MLNIFVLIFLLFSPCFALDKNVIRLNPKKIIEEPAESAEDYCRVAIAYVYDQEVDKSFFAFLKALDLAENFETPSFQEGEKDCFDKACAIYLTDGANDPIKAARLLLEEFEDIIKVHPEYAHLQFIVSTAYGNLGIYDEFFEQFFRHYSKFKNTYLSYKIQGILFLRLSQHAKSEIERNKLQESAEGALRHALEKNQSDMSLYKALIYLAKDRGDSVQIKKILNNMIAATGSVPRSDLLAHIKEACALKEYNLAQQIIDKARQDYQYSRTLIAAEEYLKKAKG